MSGKPTFKEEIQSYLGGRMVTDGRTGKSLKATQKRLAYELGMQPETLSRKLSSSLPLTEQDVHDIGSILIYWKRITRRSQLKRLLNLGGYPLSGDEWQEEPWDSLIDDTLPPEEAMQQARLEDRKQDVAAPPETPEIYSNLPFPPNPYFIGRDIYLEQLRQFLQEHGNVTVTQSVAISGLGGIGKTQLALAYAYQWYPNLYHVVLWIDAATQATIDASCLVLARRLNLPEQNEQEMNRIVQAVRQWLERHTNWLLIMDNADDLDLARSFFPSTSRGHIVVTTRSQSVGTAVARQIELPEMIPVEGLHFLLKRSKLLFKPNSVTVDILKSGLQLVELLGGHPLALDQAGAYIEETGISIDSYIRRYRHQHSVLLGQFGPLPTSKGREHPESVVTTFELSLQKACAIHPTAEDLAQLFACMQSDAIAERLFRDEASDTYYEDFDACVAALRRYSLIKHDRRKKVFSMPRLVREVIIDTMPPDLQILRRLRMVTILFRSVNYYAVPLDGTYNWWLSERVLPHILVCATWTDDEPILMVDVARLLYSAAMYFSVRGRAEEAEPLFERALSIFERHRGREHPETVAIMANMAELEVTSFPHKKEQTRLLLEEVLSILENRFGPEHPKTAHLLHLLAENYKLDDRERYSLLLDRAVSIQEKMLDPEHADIVESLQSLATFFIGYPTDGEPVLLRTRLEQLEASLIQVLAIWEKDLGTEHPRLVEMLYRIVYVLYMEDLLHIEGKHELLEAYFERASSLEHRLHAMYSPIERPKRTFADFLRTFDIETLADELADWDALETAHNASEDISES